MSEFGLPTSFGQRGGGSGSALLPEYFNRIVDYAQMDFASTFYQMVTLAQNPSKVYKTSYYRKQTKNQWARDDPAFAVVQFAFLVVSACAYAIVFEYQSTYLYPILSNVLVQWIGSGVLHATVGWWLSNKYLRMHHEHSVEQEVEWLYAFDIHCNSFFLLFLVQHVLQFFLLPLLLGNSFLALFFSNTLYAAGFAVYYYVTFLGYMALPFLQNTQCFLYPIGVVILLYCCSIGLGFFGMNTNASQTSAGLFYDYY
jgi:hypothetical protein